MFNAWFTVKAGLQPPPDVPKSMFTVGEKIKVYSLSTILNFLCFVWRKLIERVKSSVQDERPGRTNSVSTLENVDSLQVVKRTWDTKEPDMKEMSA